MTVNTPIIPDFSAQTGTTYVDNVDGGFSVSDRIAWAFAPHEQSTPDMTVRLDAGSIFNVDTDDLTEVAAQSTATITAPSTNPRNDIVYIDEATGTVGVVAGAEAASPADPAIPAGKIPVARVSLTTSTSTITNAILSDLRPALVNGYLKPDGDGSQLTGVGTNRANTMLNALRILTNGGLAVQNMVDGVVDAFSDESGVDTGTSTNETYDATGDYYYNPGVASIVFTTNATDSTNGTTHTFSSQSIGTADSNRKVVVGISYNNSPGSITVSSVTIAGVTATSILNDVGPNSRELAIFQADVPTGTTGDIVITTSVSADSIGIGVWAVYDAASTAYQTQTSTANPLTTDLDVPAGGVAIGVARSSSSSTYSWTNITEDYEQTNEATLTDSGASAAFSSQQTNLTITPGESASNYPALAVISFAKGASATVPNMTLISDAVTAATTPGTAYLTLWQEDVDSATLNTDIKAYVSRDGGTTYTLGTLVEKATLGDARLLVASDIDISGQPSGTSMKWKVQTFNNKEQRIHGVGLEWS